MSIKQGDYLKALRQEHKLSQEQLSEILGISRQSISKWEQGNSAPDIDNLAKLSEYYGVSVDSLVKGEPDEAQVEMPKEEEKKEDKKENKKEEVKEKKDKPKKSRHWIYAGFPVIAVMAYCIIGSIFGVKGWAFGWIVLLTIPLFYTGAIAIKKKKPIIFCYPVLMVMLYLVLGLIFKLWHPAWIIFLTIPLYYIITAKAGKR